MLTKETNSNETVGQGGARFEQIEVFRVLEDSADNSSTYFLEGPYLCTGSSSGDSADWVVLDWFVVASAPVQDVELSPSDGSVTAGTRGEEAIGEKMVYLHSIMATIVVLVELMNAGCIV